MESCPCWIRVSIHGSGAFNSLYCTYHLSPYVVIVCTSCSNSKPEGSFSFQQLNENYYPGDVRFDPLGLKPSDPEEFALIQTKELQNGRLAMIGAMGMIVQELVE